ncbi:MAG: hypothetical protein KGI06_03050 [Candidatus Micrarchaeota archaeon]|nr:hypothetical protein [Candidatus Micrarchaeota archaeon]
MGEYRKRRTYNVIAKHYTRVMRLSNGQFIVTIPRELTRWKNIGKGTLLKWSNGGENRLIVEIIK